MKDNFSLKVTAQIKNLAAVHRFVEKTAATLGLGSSDSYDLLLAVDEAVTNIIVHGYKGLGGKIEIRIKQEGDILAVRLRDDALPFDPNSVPPPDLTKPLAERDIGGMGVYLIHQTMDQVIHRVTPTGGNELTLLKRRAGNIEVSEEDEL